MLREAQDNFKKNLETTIFRTGSPSTETQTNIAKELKLDDNVSAASSASGAMGLILGQTQAVIEYLPDSRRTSGFTRHGILDVAGPSGLQFSDPPIVDKKGRRKVSI